MEVSRRAFLTSAGWIAAHAMTARGAGAVPAAQPVAPRPHILSLELATSAPLARMREFYEGALGQRVREAAADRIVFQTGESTLAFSQVPDGAPFYHFAFNIPENRIVEARQWQLARSPLLPIPATLRDAAFPDDVVDYRHWNAHSIFFLDPGGNVVEYIARHDLKNASGRPFGPADVLYASEIGIIVDDVPAAAAAVGRVTGLATYRGASEVFTPLGSEHGLLLLMKRGRILNFQPASQEKAARVCPTVAHVRGTAPGRHPLPGFPYEIVVE